jgi:toxin ParE1/3/4
VTTLRVRPAAERDVDAATDRYAREAGLDVALRYLNTIEETYQQIASNPDAGAPVLAFSPRLVGLRFWPVTSFEKHLVFYVPEPGGVKIVRVLHGARDLTLELESE